MPNYFNPASMLVHGGIDPKSPFAGALAGIQGAYSMRAGDDAQTMNSLSIMEQLEKLNQEIAKREMYDTERTKKITTNKYDTEDITSGRRLDRDIVKADTEKENLKGKKQDNEIKQREEQEKFIVQLAEEIKTNDFSPYDDRWNERRDEGGKLGLKLPPFLQDKDKMFIINKAKGIVNNAGQQRRMAEITHTGEENLRTNVLPTIAGNASIQESMAAIQHNYRMKEKAADNESKEKIAASRSSIYRTFESLAADAIAKNDVSKLEVILTQWLQEEIKNQPLLAVNPKAQEEWKANKRKELLMNMTGKGETTQAPPAQAAPSSNKMPEVSSKEAYDKLPSGTRYMSNGKEYIKK